MKTSFQIGERSLFSFQGQHMKQLFQHLSGLGMEEPGGIAALIVSKRICVLVSGTIIDLAGCHSVHEHLRHIASWHLHCRNGIFGVGAVIKPVFIMVTVASLVMKPRLGIALIFPLRIVGAAVALIVSCSYQEFRRTEFGKIMQKPLPVQTDGEAGLADQKAMPGNGTKMFCRLFYCNLLFLSHSISFKWLVTTDLPDPGSDAPSSPSQGRDP